MRLFRVVMNGLSLNLKRFLKTVLATFCIGMSLSLLFPIMPDAYGSSVNYSSMSAISPRHGASAPSNVTKGEEQMKTIEKKSEDYMKPENTFSPDKIREESNKGLNEVQGGADFDKMYRPSNSQGAETVEDDVKKALDKVQRDT